MSTRQIDSARRRLTDASRSAPFDGKFPFLPYILFKDDNPYCVAISHIVFVSTTQGGLTNLALFVLGKIRRVSWIID
jgi:hypothetical protein